MIEARADVALGEAIEPSTAAIRKIHVTGPLMLLLAGAVCAAGIIGGWLLGLALQAAAPRLASIAGQLWLVGGIAGLLTGLHLMARRHLKGFLASLQAMGSPAAYPTRFLFEENAIRIENDRLSHRIAWEAVLFIIPERDHRLIQVDSLTIAVPRRAFADDAAERAFLDLAAARLTPEARARSVLAKQ